MGGFSDLLLYFTLYSLIGWVMETTFAAIVQKRFVNRGFLTGPFCPIYGFGAVIIIEASSFITKIMKAYTASMITALFFSIILVTILEYITGYILEKFFSCRWWDYSKNVLNINGYVCLRYSLLWGVLAFLLIQVVHPLISGIIMSIPYSVKVYISIILPVYFLADTVKSIINALDLRSVIINYSSFSLNKYHEKILQYKRFFLAFPHLLVLNAEIINRDVRSILNEKFDKIKDELKTRFQ